MTDEQLKISVRFSDEFKQRLSALAKKYRNIRQDVEPLIQEIQAGNFLGDRLSGLGENYVVYKVRAKNSNIQKGKSAGYRIIYQVHSSTNVILLNIYSKSERQDITAEEIGNIVAQSASKNGGDNGSNTN